MNRKKQTKRTAKKRVMSQSRRSIDEWVRFVEGLIAIHSSAPFKSGKRKGHSTTNAQNWLRDLAITCEAYIKKEYAGQMYDGNLAMASLMSTILAAWYAQCHRAKAMDPNRPLQRKQVFKRLDNYRRDMISAITDERIMANVWSSQKFNFPFGAEKKGGKFI